MNPAGPPPTALVQPAGAPTDTRRVRRLTLTFTGSGSEYFRIWIVNLLLTLVTFGSTAGACRALLPSFVPALLLTAPLVGVADRQPPPWYGWLSIVVLLASLLMLPWLLWTLKKYQRRA